MRISKKSRWLVFVVFVAGALIALMRPQSQPVRLLHVGYADHGESGRSPVFCLTNEGTRSISFVANSTGRPAFDYKVRTAKGWEGPYPFRETSYSSSSGFTLGSQITFVPVSPPANVLKPGEGITFEFARPLGPRGWKMGIAYRTCTVTAAPPATVWAARSTNAQAIAFVPSQAAWVVREPSFASKMSDALPRGVPGWVKRAIKALDRDSVVWGPEMK